MFKETLREIASKYSDPEEFKKQNPERYAIARTRGWIKEFFPTYTPQRGPVIPEEAQLVETPSDANLRHAIDDYIVNLRIIKAKKGERPKIHIARVLKDLEKILKDH